MKADETIRVLANYVGDVFGRDGAAMWDATESPDDRPVNSKFVEVSHKARNIGRQVLRRPSARRVPPHGSPRPSATNHQFGIVRAVMLKLTNMCVRINNQV